MSLGEIIFEVTTPEQNPIVREEMSMSLFFWDPGSHRYQNKTYDSHEALLQPPLFLAT